MPDWEAYYDTRLQFDPRRSTVWRSVCKYLQRELPENSSILELGAGYCDFINNIKAAKKFALDIVPIVKEAALPQVEALVGSCADLSFLSDSSIDVVFASNLLEHLHLEQISQTCQEVLRVLKPEGKLIVMQPNFRYCFREYFDDYTHVSVFTDKSLSDLLTASGFKISRLEARFTPFSMKGRLPVASWLIDLYLRSPIRPFAGQMLIIAQK